QSPWAQAQGQSRILNSTSPEGATRNRPPPASPLRGLLVKRRRRIRGLAPTAICLRPFGAVAFRPSCRLETVTMTQLKSLTISRGRGEYHFASMPSRGFEAVPRAQHRTLPNVTWTAIARNIPKPKSPLPLGEGRGGLFKIVGFGFE